MVVPWESDLALAYWSFFAFSTASSIVPTM
jgi:hypothetical protein